MSANTRSGWLNPGWRRKETFSESVIPGERSGNSSSFSNRDDPRPSQDEQANLALIKLAERDSKDEWMRAAILSSSFESSAHMLLHFVKK